MKKFKKMINIFMFNMMFANKNGQRTNLCLMNKSLNKTPETIKTNWMKKID